MDCEQGVGDGIELFNRGRFFECHEALESVWVGTRGPRRWFLQALIHLAVAFYHVQRGNPEGAVRQLRKGLRKLAGYLPAWEGLDTLRLYRGALACLETLEAGARPAGFPTIDRLPGNGYNPND